MAPFYFCTFSQRSDWTEIHCAQVDYSYVLWVRILCVLIKLIYIWLKWCDCYMKWNWTLSRLYQLCCLTKSDVWGHSSLFWPTPAQNIVLEATQVTNSEENLNEVAVVTSDLRRCLCFCLVVVFCLSVFCFLIIMLITFTWSVWTLLWPCWSVFTSTSFK